MNTPVYIVSTSPGLASWVALCHAHRSSAWITLGSRLQRRCGLDPWCFKRRYLWTPSEPDFVFQDQLLPLNKPCVSYAQDTCLFFFFSSSFMLLLPGYPAFCISQLAGNKKDLHGVSPTNERAASHALCGLHIPRQIANGICTIEQVKLATSVWFFEDERDAGFCFTWQAGLVSREKSSGETQGRTSGRSRI